ncbi:MAG: M20/M25/M40 family metallo-hydrolase [Gammaproteobacteria bacterium]
MTYYGCWMYKFEEAKRQGAAAALAIHETDPAGYEWDIVQKSFGNSQLILDDADIDESALQIEGWLHIDAAKALFERAGLDFQELKEEAADKDSDFEPRSLGSAQLEVNSDVEATEYSNNIVAMLEGDDDPNETVLVTAHWDHLGTNQDGEIFNGAIDNAAGLAGVLELARLLKSEDKTFKRSILFVNFSAEEAGLLGAIYFTQHLPVDMTVSAVLNLEGLNVNDTVDYITNYNPGGDLECLLQDAANAQGRTVELDPTPQDGKKFRSDHWPFGLQGIPWLLFWFNDPDYFDNRYHQPTDIYNENWTMKGAIQDLDLIKDIIEKISNKEACDLS